MRGRGDKGAVRISQKDRLRACAGVLFRKGDADERDEGIHRRKGNEMGKCMSADLSAAADGKETLYGHK